MYLVQSDASRIIVVGAKGYPNTAAAPCEELICI